MKGNSVRFVATLLLVVLLCAVLAVLLADADAMVPRSWMPVVCNVRTPAKPTLTACPPARPTLTAGLPARPTLMPTTTPDNGDE